MPSVGPTERGGENCRVRQPEMFREITVDSFAGGGGASQGIEWALGRPVDIAINHDPAAIAMHRANHPDTEHYCESVWDVDPLKVTYGRPVSLFWLSPDCKHFSKAKGGKPVDKSIRGLAWIAALWGAVVRPRVIMFENVVEFKTWGPLDDEGKPIKARAGETFNAFVAVLTTGLSKDHPAWPEIKEALGNNFPYEKLEKGLGYQVEFREIKACDYRAPTIRKRLFGVFRRDGFPIIWPEPTHGDPKSEVVQSGRLKPWRTAAEIIDWSLPCPSIFNTSDDIKAVLGIKTVRPLAENTVKRIAKGTEKFVIKNPEPFIIRVNHTGSEHHYCNSVNEPLSTITSKNGWGIVIPSLTQYHSYEGDGARGQALDRPLLTVDTNPRYALTAAFFTKYYSNEKTDISIKDPVHTITAKDRVALVETHLCILRNHMDCKDLNDPIPTVMTSPGHFAEVRTMLTKIVGSQDLGHWPKVREMLNQHCGYSIADDEILLLEINGDFYFISDIGMRMLVPRELFNAQGFPEDYIIDRDYQGNKYPLSAQVARCGNSVSPPIPYYLVRANLPDQCKAVA